MKLNPPFRRYYESYEGSERNASEDLIAHLKGGIVFSNVGCLVLARTVIRAAPESEILDPTHQFPCPRDALFVWYADGTLHDVFTGLYMGISTSRGFCSGAKWVGWQRGGSGPIRWHWRETLMRHILPASEYNRLCRRNTWKKRVDDCSER